MKKNKISFYLSLSLIILLYSAEASFSISVAVKVESDYRTVLQNFRFISSSIENFANNDQKKKFEDIKTLFTNASAEYYARNYDSSLKKFIKTKEDLAVLLDALTIVYLNRSKEILDSTTKAAFEILINYTKQTYKSKSLRKPFDPIENIKTHSEKDYHLFHDRDKIEKYLNIGYEKLGEANLAYKDPDLEYTKSKKSKSRQNIEFLLERYTNIITLCKQAKMYGIEIYKIINADKIGSILVKYNIPGMQIENIYDDRIPDGYKLDAIDNNNIVYAVEKKKIERFQKIK